MSSPFLFPFPTCIALCASPPLLLTPPMLLTPPLFLTPPLPLHQLIPLPVPAPACASAYVSLFVSHFSSSCAMLSLKTCSSITQSKTYRIAYVCRQSQMAAAVMLRQPPWPPGQPLPSTPASVATCTCPKTCPPLSRPPWQGLQMMYWQTV